MLSGDWLVIEPTPGYDVLGPRLSWTAWAWATALAVAVWLWQHILPVSICFLGLAVLSWKNRELRDTLGVMLWHVFPGRCWRTCVRHVLWLLERRGRWAGSPRQPSQTQSTWLRTVLPAGNNHRAALGQLTMMAEWSAYAPDLVPPWPPQEVQTVCRRVLDEWSLPRWRTLVHAGAVQGECS
jgi:protein-glutamine gamma-glutamyltransferase